jgi:imidazolonepropionase-like amidohydrolase
LVDQIGSVEAGKFADIIAVQGDPLSDIHVMEQVVFVLKGGAVIRNDIPPATEAARSVNPPLCSSPRF